MVRLIHADPMLMLNVRKKTFVRIFKFNQNPFIEPRQGRSRNPELDSGVDQRAGVVGAPTVDGRRGPRSHGGAAGAAPPGQNRDVEPRGADQHLLGRQLAGALLHLAEVDPAPDHELPRDSQVAAGNSRVPKCIFAAAQGIRTRRQPHCHLQAGPNQAGG
jgi:hypothetical protein